MTDIPEQAVAAIKLSRADAVKMVADQLAADCAGDVAARSRAVAEAQDTFRAWAVRTAVNSTNGGLDAAMAVVGSAALPMHGSCIYQLNLNDDPGDTCTVVFSDCQKTYDARMKLSVSIPVDGIGADLRGNWYDALVDLKDARERDLRVGQMKKDAREALIKAALADSAEGEAVVAAIKALSAALKVKA